MPTAKKEIVIPTSVFETADTKEDLEDWLMANNAAFIKKVRKSREDDLAGKGKGWKALKTVLDLSGARGPQDILH